jgi:hypothetical protein
MSENHDSGRVSTRGPRQDRHEGESTDGDCTDPLMSEQPKASKKLWDRRDGLTNVTQQANSYPKKKERGM